MPFQPVPNGAQVVLKYQQVGQIMENIFWVRSDVPFEAADLETLASTFQTWWSDTYKSLQHPTVSLIEITATAEDTDTGPQFILPITGPNVGTASGNAEPLNATISIQHITALRGRSFRGRTYHVGLTSDQLLDAGHVLAATAASLRAAYDTLVTDIHTVSATWELSVLTRFTNHLPRPAGILTPIVANGLADTALDSQRRRLPGRGQ